MMPVAPEGPQTFVQFTKQSTGDRELDAIAICLDVFDWLVGYPDASQRVLHYLNDRVGTR